MLPFEIYFKTTSNQTFCSCQNISSSGAMAIPLPTSMNLLPCHPQSHQKTPPPSPTQTTPAIVHISQSIDRKKMSLFSIAQLVFIDSVEVVAIVMMAWSPRERFHFCF